MGVPDSNRSGLWTRPAAASLKQQGLELLMLLTLVALFSSLGPSIKIQRSGLPACPGCQGKVIPVLYGGSSRGFDRTPTGASYQYRPLLSFDENEEWPNLYCQSCGHSFYREDAFASIDEYIQRR